MTVQPQAPDRRQELLRARLAKARARRPDSARTTIPRRPEQAPVTMSDPQRRLWFLAQYEPESPAYNIPLAARLSGELDRDALVGALERVVARHEVLRTIHPTLDGEPAPVVEPAGAFQVQVVDLEPAEADPWLSAHARRPFDLAHELPVRAALLRTGEHEHVLSIVLHHIAADGWSIGVLADELAAGYAALRAGEEPRLPELAVQYADIAHWQSGAIASAVDGQLGWWVDALRGAPATVTVPTDRPRPAVAGTRGRRITVDCGADRSARIRGLAAEVGATPFVVLLAALQTVLHRYTGSDDVVVGCPIAGRTHSEMEPVIGCFVNTLALRTDLSGEPTVRQLLARVRETTFGAFGHQDVPFERLVDALHPERDLSHTPLFQVMLNVHNQPQPSLTLPALVTEWTDTATETAKFDVSIAVVDRPGEQLSADLVWRTELYDEATIRRLFGHLTTVLDAMAADPDAPLAAVPLLTAAEQAELTAWNSTGRAYPADGTLHALIERQAARTPDAIAVAAADATLSYAELDGRANRLAHELARLGVAPGAPVGLFADRGAGLIVGMLGILKAGGAYLPLDPVYPDHRVRELLAAAGAAAVVTSRGLAGRLGSDPAVPAAVLLDDLEDATADAPPAVELRADALCYVLFTSGSTGRPKAVAVEHRNYLNYLHGLRERTGAEPGWSWALVSTFAADLGTTNVFGALTGGGTLHVLPHEVATDVDAFAGYFRRHRVDAVKLVPSHLEALAGRTARLADVLPRRLLICAGEPLRWDLVARVRTAAPRLAVHNHYGPTETTVSMLGTAVPASQLPTPTVPLGTPFGNVGAHVLDARRRPVPVGVPGELWVSGAGVARGYLGRPDLTAERFMELAGIGRAYRTGDVVRRHPDGALEFLGRADHQVKVRGFRVEVGEVEAHLVGLPGVREAVVTARGDGPSRKLVGYLVPSNTGTDTGTGPLVSAIRAALRAELPDYMVPAALVVVDALPLNANGKVDRAALGLLSEAEPAAPSTVDDAGAAPSSESQLRVAEAFAEVLGCPVASVDDDFFALGGDSFSAVRTARRIDPGLSVIELFQHPTVAELAAVLDARAAGADGGARSCGPETGGAETGGARAGGRLLHRLTRRGRHAELTVVCVPYGGGSPITFQPLADELPGNVALHAVGLPGHDTSRPDEPLMALDELADAVVAEIQRQITGPVLVYGHCLGGALATAVGARLEAAGGRLRGVALGGTFPAARMPGRFFDWLARVLPADRMLSNRTYLDYLRAMGGFTDGYDAADRELLMRALRHDVRQAEEFYTRAYGEGSAARMRAPILCVVGEKDRATELYDERYTEWSHFSDDVQLAVIPRAGHYFLKHQATELAAILTAWARGDGGDGVPPSTTNPPVGGTWSTATTSARLSLRTFAAVAIGQFVSMIGTGLSAFALGVWVFQRTGSAADFALISMMAVLPAILLSPVAGAVADRLDRRRVMIVSDTVAACGTAALATVLWTGGLQLWHIYLLCGLGAVCNAFQRPAYVAAIAQLVPKRYLGQANAFAQAGTSAGDLLAALAGGVLVSLVGLHGVVLIDMASFLVGVGVLIVVRFPDLLFVRREEPLLREVVTGWHYIVRRRSLVAMVLFFMVFNYLFAIATVLVTPLVLAAHTATVLGVVSAIGGIGGLAGVVVMALWGGTRRRAVGMVGYTSGVGAATVLIGLGAHPAFVAAGLFGLWASLMILNSHWMSLIQSKVGMELQGRVLATNQMLAMSMMPLGFLTAGPLADDVFEPLMRPDGPLAGTVGALLGVGPGRGIGLLLACVGAVLVVWGVLGLAYRPLRRIEDVLPDAVPDAEIADKDTLQAAADRAALRVA